MYTLYIFITHVLKYNNLSSVNLFQIVNTINVFCIDINIILSVYVCIVRTQSLNLIRRLFKIVFCDHIHYLSFNIKQK